MMMLDNAFAIFNNLAPRLQWAEIDLPFPSDDLYFKAAKYDDLRNHSGFPIPKMKIRDAFLLLFSPADSAERDLLPLRGGNLTALDMQMLMHGMSFLSFPFFPFLSPPKISSPDASILTPNP
jgi:hypothetical protein